MSVSLAQAVVSLPQFPFPPLAVGFMGLGTGYLVSGPQELFGYPKRDDDVDFATGMWGIWMPGFMQFITGVYLFLGLTLFGTFRTPALYMTALAFSKHSGLPTGGLAYSRDAYLRVAGRARYRVIVGGLAWHCARGGTGAGVQMERMAPPSMGIMAPVM